MHLIVGLGNPGTEYENTRHNAGFMVAEELARIAGIPGLKFKKKCSSLVGEGELNGARVVVAEPQTFMNLSGDAVQALVGWYKIAPGRLIVAYDDVDLDVGQLRIREGGGSGGHHGIESVIGRTGTPEFIRVRIGVGRETLSGDVSGYVLSKIPRDQGELIAAAVAEAGRAIESVVTEGVSRAISRFSK